MMTVPNGLPERWHDAYGNHEFRGKNCSTECPGYIARTALDQLGDR